MGRQLDFAVLTSQIKAAATIEAMLCMHRAHLDLLNHIHLAACWTLLGQLARQQPAERCCLQKNPKALEALVQQTVKAALAGQINTRGLANVVHGAAHSGGGGLLSILFATLSTAVERQVVDFNA